MTMLPTLETDRLILMPRTTEHLEECLEMDKDPEVTKYILGVWDGGQEHIATKNFSAGYTCYRHRTMNKRPR